MEPRRRGGGAKEQERKEKETRKRCPEAGAEDGEVLGFREDRQGPKQEQVDEKGEVRWRNRWLPLAESRVCGTEEERGVRARRQGRTPVKANVLVEKRKEGGRKNITQVVPERPRVCP